MATPGPSSLFLRLANAWAHLSLRSDVDDIILELLGHFSLEKIYAGPADRETYQHLVKVLLAQLDTIFYIQRLTLPADNLHVGWYLGFLASWEVTIRSVEFVLQAVVDGRESLWDDDSLRDRYLARFLMSALRILTLHPKAPANQRAKDRRDRFARIHRLLEQVFDSYPGPKSFLLEVCMEVTNGLHVDPDSLGLPPRLRYELPNMTTELVRASPSILLAFLQTYQTSPVLTLVQYPLATCLSPQYILELAPRENFAVSWLSQFLALRDVSHFVVGASVQYAANRETRDVRLQSSSARSRNAILNALDNVRLPSHLSKVDMVATFSSSFRVILPDTLDLSRQSLAESRIDECELDALDALCARLKERQVIHRMSDKESMHNISQVVRSIALQDDPSGKVAAARPGLYVMNCSSCHFVGDSQLRSSDVRVPSDSVAGSEIRLPPSSKCVQCGEDVSVVREVPLLRQAYELLRPLEPDADTINVERHLPTQFQLSPPKVESGGTFTAGYSNELSPVEQRPHSTEQHHTYRERVLAPEPTSPGLHRLVSPALSLPQSPYGRYAPGPSRTEPSRLDSSSWKGKRVLDYTQADRNIMTEPPPFSTDTLPLYKSSPSGADSLPILSPTEGPAPEPPKTTTGLTPPEKGKSKWRMKFTGPKKPSAGASGDSSSLSSTALEAQKLEEISLGSLFTMTKSSARTKIGKSINVTLAQNSTFALFWTQLSIYVWDVGTSPPTLTRAISTESTCILAAVAKLHLAYVIGTRDQKLTLRIVNLVQPSAPVVEYRISSSLWCKSITIDREENYVVIGFENSTVRFFKTTNTEQPREDRLHSPYHNDCKGCPSVDTLAFSNDGLVLLAGTRNPRTGLIQVYRWGFPFLTFQELPTCRYPVPLHESEDNGISTAIIRPGTEGHENVVCITTWTQSGTPVLIQPQDGHRTEIKPEASGRHGKLGSRIQCAAFSPSGKELALVNDKGYLYQVLNVNSSPLDVRRVAVSRELTARSDSFAMAFMVIEGEENIVMAWADSSKATGWVKKVPLMSIARGSISVPQTPGPVYEASGREEPRAEMPGENTWPPVELAATELGMGGASTVGSGSGSNRLLSKGSSPPT
ncbi:hypothetical protein B0T19DRAFT_361510 [Cercophora scortea]|uniref:WD40 repeat protein n=1 Tax=Cercophora scortea TaxID=314031 RepID=A0AAE0M647_9PEZI|nr:hypothetical protein B0T19DRAFT_361510 [Cercophora scortea]